jgi:heme oxygenase (biliverdin-producing, ferredoxin)
LTPSLAERLRSETRALHLAAERSRLMRVLTRGELSRSAYCAVLCNLHTIYSALEIALARHAANPLIAPITQQGLARTGPLESDLRVLHGPGWRTELTSGQSAATYARRLQEIDTDQPGLLLAHAYVRYLGDLSGGQMLARIVARSLGLSDGVGTAFYHFGDPVQVQSRVRAFREGLGSIELELERAAANAIVGEAVWSFRMHRLLFFELAIATGLTRAHASRASWPVGP